MAARCELVWGWPTWAIAQGCRVTMGAAARSSFRRIPKAFRPLAAPRLVCNVVCTQATFFPLLLGLAARGPCTLIAHAGKAVIIPQGFRAWSRRSAPLGLMGFGRGSILEVFAAGGAAGITGQEPEHENPDEEEDDRINRDLEGEHGSVLGETCG